MSYNRRVCAIAVSIRTNHLPHCTREYEPSGTSFCGEPRSDRPLGIPSMSGLEGRAYVPLWEAIWGGVVHPECGGVILRI
jgi:hypothetical protein